MPFNLSAFNPNALKEIGMSNIGNAPPTNTGFTGGRLGNALPIPQSQGFISPMVGQMNPMQSPMLGQRPQMGMANPRQPKPGNMGARPRGRMF